MLTSLPTAPVLPGEPNNVVSITHQRATHIVQVTPTTYSRNSVIGGGEKLVLYTDHALRRAAEASNLAITTSVLSFGTELGTAYSDRDINYEMIPGRPWEAGSINADDLILSLRKADVVYVDQCLCQVGMLVAAHARLLGKLVIGKDAGAGEYPILQ